MHNHPSAAILREAERIATLPYTQWPAYYDDMIAILDRTAEAGVELTTPLTDAQCDELRAMSARLRRKRDADTAPVIGGFTAPRP